METNALVRSCIDALEEEIRACVGESPTSFYDLIRYHMGWVDERGKAVSRPSGKMLRPVLCLLSCQAVGGDYRRALPAAAAIEMVHNFSLIHDDIQDQSTRRRHRPTVWSIWGQALAITAGDGLHVLAHLAHLRLVEREVQAGTALATLKVLEKACLDLCEGQYLDLSFEGLARIGLEEYQMMVGKKTAALFSAAARIGAMVGTQDGGAIEALGRFGEELGMAFQVQDDMLGIWGAEKTTGKPCLDDIRARKKSLPIVHALAAVHGPDRELLEKAYGVETGVKPAPTLGEETVSSVVSILEAAGSRDYCQSLARSYWDRASSRLDGLVLEQEAETALRDLVKQMAERQL